MRPRKRPEKVGNYPGSLNIPFPSTNIELLSCDDLADMLNRDAFESLLAVVSLKYVSSLTVKYENSVYSVWH